MGFEEIARLLPLLGPLADACPGGNNEQRQMIALAVRWIENEVAETERIIL